MDTFGSGRVTVVLDPLWDDQGDHQVHDSVYTSGAHTQQSDMRSPLVSLSQYHQKTGHPTLDRLLE